MCGNSFFIGVLCTALVIFLLFVSNRFGVERACRDTHGVNCKLVWIPMETEQ